MAIGQNGLRIALIISAILHGTIVFLPYLKFKPPEGKPEKLDLTYLKDQPEHADTIKTQIPKRDISLGHRQSPARINTDLSGKDSVHKPISLRRASSSIIEQGPLRRIGEFLKTKPHLPRPDVIAVKKKVALTPLELNKISSPSYISYYQIVREKIKRAAYQNYNTDQTGEVYISFLIASDGNLIANRVIDEKSTPNHYLKKVAVKSINDAAKFPAFPPDLDYAQLSFNVVISFEIE